ncbi:hypothetical protein [Aureispira anguillae]|uniref:Cytochrome C Planctomycete-type domain-containing protein n=1 Tax=Aureispira anguillae TaxID=2864201 RepID=A0A915YF52_9BACT|nr:hypothetical protein [Aureispira anguillae]BDS11983.1 hypothetical protein AsAng_0026980 [Aureispira anguillae]
MLSKILFASTVLFITLITFSACQKDNNTSYQDVKTIISTSCAVSGCHDATTAKKNIDYTSYATMSGATGLTNSLHKNSNGFHDRVLVVQDMPIGGTLSQADKDLLQQWVDNGYAEN